MPSGPDGPFVPAFRGGRPGRMSGFDSEGIPVDSQQNCAILESGLGLMSVGISSRLQTAFPDVHGDCGDDAIPGEAENVGRQSVRGSR